MSFSLKPDYDESYKRYEAFWHHEVIDRAPVSIVLPAEKTVPVPEKAHKTLEDRWTDVDFRAEKLAAEAHNREYFADALPVVWPNMGPEIFSAWCGCPYFYGEGTTWTEPCIADWAADAEKAVLDMDHPLFRLLVRFTERLLELGRDAFIVGLTDFHPGGDHLAALRDPEALAIDMIENVDAVEAKLAASYPEYYAAYDVFYEMLSSAGMPITSWLPLVHTGRYYIPSNDFSCMISTKMFEDVFLPGIIDECRFLDRSIYHLDGPGALRHLDLILDIPELDAVQWQFGAGNEGYERWIPVYRKIQNAGKSMQIVSITLDELPRVFETLRPEGVWFSHIDGIEDRETAERVVKRIRNWK
ncbi:MAG: hypothetical protein EA426_16535 [Spirochaetaceae bacterium]|nr:MAG: hypothetical protein EA426_16535 [Spirochaetaceae bacterium]